MDKESSTLLRNMKFRKKNAEKTVFFPNSSTFSQALTRTPFLPYELRCVILLGMHTGASAHGSAVIAAPWSSAGGGVPCEAQPWGALLFHSQPQAVVFYGVTGDGMDHPSTGCFQTAVCLGKSHWR